MRRGEYIGLAQLSDKRKIKCISLEFLLILGLLSRNMPLGLCNYLTVMVVMDRHVFGYNGLRTRGRTDTFSPYKIVCLEEVACNALP